MFNSLIEEHQQKQAALRDENEKLRKAALNSVAEVTECLVDTLNSDVSECFRTQKQIELESRKLQAEALRFSKQTQQWINMVSTFDKSLKEIGDFENWVKTMEWDMQTVATALERVHQSTDPK
mmetsp:Transcript_33823/g.40886  ORF Transcript_33823/g.40886 Transcript_33823/m.40886 type:complete len:123 (-) Transcript_33823:523-891(-)|eukprot:CAMPEP_0197866464 /NCGR_PEP_ID=MMETSP1438-20131217/44229_1 /TAXON_ID=1461541 /ORGANISM="Pterosperma sp., Strain CCMP1384" /LENGTH=122 /DNA_ID=CAMNT_0043485033 /DNA_START=158 /DNA_END=526 /DNA_ORIENTATION=-